MTLDDRAAYRQANAQAMRFSRVKRFEQFLNTARIQANASVPNQQFHTIAAINRCLYSKCSGSVFDARHGIGPIHHQIQDDLLQLHAIAENGRQGFRELCLQDRAALS